MSYNEVSIIGNVGVAPKVYEGQDGSEYVRFSVASNRIIRNQDGTTEEVTIWFNITKRGHGSMASFASSFVKGSKVFIKGQLVADKTSGHPKIFTNKAGEPDAAYEVSASVVVFLGNPAPKEKPFVSNLMKMDYPEYEEEGNYDEEE